jgi:hypothetical protein
MTHPAFDQGEGILRLAPAWVPRVFCIPGKRIKLHPADLYAFGAHRGGIDERWFSSTTKADNGPLTTPDEGLSYVIYGDEDNPRRELLADLVQQLGADLLGAELWNAYHAWPVYSKFFDNKGALPHHIHQMEEHAARVGQNSKPEAYYFPRQLNNYGADFPYTFFGMAPGTTAAEIRHCLEIWDEGDNHITDLSTAYRLELGTGWYVPAGILHAPGSLCTYEPQWASDVFAFFQSLVNEVPMDWELVVKNVPEECKNDLDYIVSMVDLPANTNPNFKRDHFRKPAPVKPLAEMQDAGYTEHWITYGNPYFAAKELTVLPGRTVTIRDAGPYGMILLQGHGSLGVWPIENPSTSDPIVMLKHFGPNREAAAVK